jgi:extracellular elastinolytic metalloproteinase
MANVAMNTNGDVLSYGSSLVPLKKSMASAPGARFDKSSQLTANQAVHKAWDSVGGKYDSNHPPTLAYLADEDGALQLTHVVRMHLANRHVIDAYVDAQNGQVRGTVDYTAHLDILAVPFTSKDIVASKQALQTNVEDFKVSPRGWTFPPGSQYRANATVGNNVFAAFVGDLSNVTSASTTLMKNAVPMTDAGVFHYMDNLAADPTTTANRDAAVAQAFYTANMMHDLLYR